MSSDSDIKELETGLSKLCSNDSKECLFVFKNKYQIILIEDWNPWPDKSIPLSQKSFLVFDRECESRKTLVTGNQAKEAYGINQSTGFFGSPLPFSIYLHDVSTFEKSIQAIHYNMLSVADARFICEIYVMMQSPTLKKIPIYVACNNKDKNHTILLGTSNQFRIIGNKKDPCSKVQTFPRMRDFISEHAPALPSSLLEIEPKHSLYAYYEIKKIPKSPAISVEPVSDGYLAIECNGTNIPKTMGRPDEHSTCTMIIQAVRGNEEQGVFSRYKELKFLQILCDSLHTGKIIWPLENPSTMVANTINTFFDGLRKDRSMKLSGYLRTSMTFSDYDLTFNSYVISNRPDMDFTDYMWLILMDCRSYLELVDSIKLIFKNLKSLPFVPYIYQRNETTMAQLTKNPDSFFDLVFESTEPVKMFFEIGVEKLSKDYVSTFVGLDVGPYNFFQTFLKSAAKFDATVKCLQKMHSTLELLIIIYMAFHLPRLELSEIVRTLINHFSSVEAVDPSFRFKFPISVFYARTALQKVQPLKWQATLSSECDGFKKHNAHVFLKDQTQSLSDSDVPVYQYSVFTCICEDFS